MTGAMYAAVSGLKAHMSALNVIGNNIANVNTTGYKASRFTFLESLYTTVGSGSDGSTEAGGRNPAQLGYGCSIGTIDLDMSTKNYSPTGMALDCMIDGDGFFLLFFSNGNQLSLKVGWLSETLFWLLGHEPPNRCSQPPGHIGSQHLNSRGVFLLMLQEFLDHRPLSKRRSADQHEEHCAAERVKIATNVSSSGISSLFRRDVVKSAQRHPADGEILFTSHLLKTGQPHINQLCPTGRRDDDV